MPLAWLSWFNLSSEQTFCLASFIDFHPILLFPTLHTSPVVRRLPSCMLLVFYNKNQRLWALPTTSSWLSMFPGLPSQGCSSKQVCFFNFLFLKIFYHLLCVFIITVLLVGFQKEAKINVCVQSS